MQTRLYKAHLQNSALGSAWWTRLCCCKYSTSWFEETNRCLCPQNPNVMSGFMQFSSYDAYMIWNKCYNRVTHNNRDPSLWELPLCTYVMSCDLTVQSLEKCGYLAPCHDSTLGAVHAGDHCPWWSGSLSILIWKKITSSFITHQSFPPVTHHLKVLFLSPPFWDW